MEEKNLETNTTKKKRKIPKEKVEKVLQKKFLEDLHKRNKIFELQLGRKFKFAHAGTAQLVEKIGESEVWQGARPILKNEDAELGNYIVMQLSATKYIFLDNVTPEDWIPTNAGKGIGKMLEVVKFADDDYRVRGKIKGKCFYQKKPVYKYEDVEQEYEDPDSGELKTIVTQEVVIDRKTGEPVVEGYEEIAWEEPKAVTQSGREAIRIMNAYKERMRQKRLAKESFLSKHMISILLIFMMILSAGVQYTTTKMQVEAIGEEWADIRNERSKGIINPEGLAKAVVAEQNKIEAHEDAPPR